MGYLTCENCGCCYKLQKGEHPQDFDSCECGGNLKYVEDLEDLSEDTYHQKMNKCPNCGTTNKEDTIFCKECGNPFNQSLNLEKKSNFPKTKKSSSNKDNNQCPHCGTKNPKSALFCQDCGVKIRKQTSKEQFMRWWNKQNTNKQGLIIISVIIFGFFGLVSMVNLLSDISLASETPTAVSISDLYGNNIDSYTYVKVSGKVVQSDEYSIRMKNSKGQDILVEGFGLFAYEGKTVTVTGIFIGPSSYTTVSGASRTVPTIRDGKIV
jgi:hypothetical protein